MERGKIETEQIEAQLYFSLNLLCLPLIHVLAQFHQVKSLLKFTISEVSAGVH